MTAPQTDTAPASAPDRTASTAEPLASAARWLRVCTLADLDVERGSAVLLGEDQLALFRLADGTIVATDNRDPYSGAQVMSRGIVGSRGEVPTVASPMFKQVFDLRTGHCLDTKGKEPASLHLWPLLVRGHEVYVLHGGTW